MILMAMLYYPGLPYVGSIALPYDRVHIVDMGCLGQLKVILDNSQQLQAAICGLASYMMLFSGVADYMMSAVLKLKGLYV